MLLCGKYTENDVVHQGKIDLTPGRYESLAFTVSVMIPELPASGPNTLRSQARPVAPSE